MQSSPWNKFVITYEKRFCEFNNRLGKFKHPERSNQIYISKQKVSYFQDISRAGNNSKYTMLNLAVTFSCHSFMLVSTVTLLLICKGNIDITNDSKLMLNHFASVFQNVCNWRLRTRAWELKREENLRSNLFRCKFSPPRNSRLKTISV